MPPRLIGPSLFLRDRHPIARLDHGGDGMDQTSFLSVDEYIKTFPKDVQRILEKMRETVKKAVPGVVEGISYRMPTFKLNGKALVYFAAFKSHIEFDPLPSVVEPFNRDI